MDLEKSLGGLLGSASAAASLTAGTGAAKGGKVAALVKLGMAKMGTLMLPMAIGGGLGAVTWEASQGLFSPHDGHPTAMGERRVLPVGPPNIAVPAPRKGTNAVATPIIAAPTTISSPIAPSAPAQEIPMAPRTKHLRVANGLAAPPPVESGAADETGAPGADPKAFAHLSEVDLIERAHRSMVSDPSLARALVAEHERRFSDGKFVEEREAIAVEALVHAGALAEAETRAERFFARFPGSAYANRIETVLQSADTDRARPVHNTTP
jgi:hypothetical protein